MSATEDDTELRDLLIQNLENNGVLNKLKAEMRAAVFLAMEEQDKLENKTPLINENLKKCLNTKDGRLVASLIVDFLQVFNLDFTLAVFQPEINSLNGLDGRDLVCRDLGLSESEVNRNCPVLLELVRRGRVRDKSVCSEEPSQRQIAHAHKKYEFYDKEHSGSVSKDNVKNAFMDLLPGLNRNMLERFISDELRAADKTSSTAIDLQLFLEMYRRLFAQCRSVVVQDPDVGPPPEKKISSPHISKFPCGPQDSDHVTSLGKGDSSPSLNRDRLDLDLEAEQDLDDGDSFFDDPLPKPQKTYGCVPLREECQAAPVVSTMRRDKSLNDLSVLAEGERDLPLSEHSQSSELRKVESSGARESPAGSQSEAPRPGGGGVGSSASESICSRSGASESREKESPDPQDLRDPQVPRDKPGSVQLDDDVEYDDDFNSHRSDFSRSELSIGEEIEEVSIEGPDTSDKLDDTTQDLSVSQLSQSHGADYMEEVA